MHYIKAKGILSAKNGINLYRGCTHGCIYCDSRSKCYQMNHDFEDIEVKENGIQLLESALRHKKSPCMLGTGAMTDPYIPLELELGMTRQVLQLAEHYGFGFTVQTKSTRILRDMDLLKAINAKSKAVVQMTLTTYDENLCRILEPNVSTTKERVAALKQFRDAGIPTVVWLCPILPFINDTKENILGILNDCVEAKVKGIVHFGMGLTLREGNREYFYKKLDEHFPGMKQRYIYTYGSNYNLISPQNKELSRLFHQFCEEHGIMHDNDEIFRYLSILDNEAEQLSLF